MKLYNPDSAVGALCVGDLLMTKRHTYVMVLTQGETVVVNTSSGKVYGLGSAQVEDYKRLANFDISGLPLSFVTSNNFVEDMATTYEKESHKQRLIASLDTIPTEALEAALEARRIQDLIG